MSQIPEALRREIIERLYHRFDAMQWEECTHAERSAEYQRLVDDPDVGGKLSLHIPRDRVRVWLKDGPAKEYRRALEGVGPYAGYTERRALGVEGVLEGVLGREWEVVEGSVGHKPMRCVVEKGGDRRLLVWGPESSVRDLFWHVATFMADLPERDGKALLVIGRRGNAPVDAALWQRAKRLGDLIGCEVSQVALAVTKKGATSERQR